MVLPLPTRPRHHPHILWAWLIHMAPDGTPPNLACKCSCELALKINGREQFSYKQKGLAKNWKLQNHKTPYQGSSCETKDICGQASSSFFKALEFC